MEGTPVVIGAVEAVVTVVVFIVFYGIGSLYWTNIDKKTESYAEECKSDIEDDPALRSIHNQQSKLMITSDSNISRARTYLRDKTPLRTDKPDRIVPVKEQSLVERKKVVIEERCRNIPGKKIIDSDLVSCLQSYYAYRLALSRERNEDNEEARQVLQHFKSRFDEHKDSGKVAELVQPEKYGKVTLLNNSDTGKNPLDDVFLPLVKRSEKHCVGPLEDVRECEEKIETCRRFMMKTFWGLYSEGMQGVNVDSSTKLKECENACRQDMKNENNFGYWLLTNGECSESDFQEFQNLGWKFQQAIDDYWGFDNCFLLHPPGDSITGMEYVDTPFIVFEKDKDEFATDPKYERKQEAYKFRKKERYRDT